ncbi:exosortase A [Altericroceibacterium endophyticum]|uniref:Exosortase A n=1 Tax=Altericroceibacterium endophyticum TaxID=1808508 RepID=A0A6I4T423_9SPHN|nr:exosortase A [Altericroceibacterium endophyticum]MXO66024.1 exosortase A [Altericroceibacterium endophyticum]
MMALSDRLKAQIPGIWRRPLAALILLWLALFTLSFGEWQAMFGQWWNSSTYNHVLLVPFILMWLVGIRWPVLRQMRPQSWWPGLIWLSAALFGWFLGRVSGVDMVGQLGAVLALQGAVMALLGPRISAALLFPLFYMLFLVPFGDELVPGLQMITARITIALTHWSGIPAQIEGVFIDTPAGLFEVAEACSGVKFLIAMIALGSLIAHVCFISWPRRIAFMALAVIVPILANGARAWGTIFIAQSQGIEFAAGFDHIFYGWIFFALVMAVLLLVAWRFFDRPVDDGPVDLTLLQRSKLLARLDFGGGHLVAVLVLALALAGGAYGWSRAVQQLEAPMPSQIAFPDVPGWKQVPYFPTVWWEPRAGGADHRLLGRYRDAQGREVDVFYALYAAQDEGREATAFGEGALPPDTPWRWAEPGPAIGRADSEILQAGTARRRLAATWYLTGDLLTGSKSHFKLQTMLNRLLMREDPSMMLILSAMENDRYSAEGAVADFTQSIAPLSGWMDRAAQQEDPQP